GMHPAGATNGCGITCYVSSGGSDVTGDGTSLNPWQTIQYGVDNVGSNGTVNVAAGTYKENVTINQPVTVAGAGQGSTFVDPAMSAPEPCDDSSLCLSGHTVTASVVFLVQSSSVNIAGLTIEGNNPSISSGATTNGVDTDARDGIETNYDAGI